MKKLVYLLTIMILMVAITSCSGSKPYTTNNKLMLGVAVVGQSADVYSTQKAWEAGKFEQNPFYGEGAKIENVILSKLILLGLGWSIGELFPERRSWFYGVIGITGISAAIYNTYNTEKHKK